MKVLNSPVSFLVILMLFMWIAWVSYRTMQDFPLHAKAVVLHRETAYTQADIASLNALYARTLGKKKLFKPKNEQEWADAAADALNLDEFKRGRK